MYAHGGESPARKANPRRHVAHPHVLRKKNKKNKNMSEIKIKDLYLGNLDAKHELLTNTDEERERFKQSFLMPENFVIENFYNNNKFYITGLKGTGKTALLRYISIAAEENKNALTSFILFKSEFKEEDKKGFSKAVNAVFTDRTENATDEDDYVSIWEWFLHRHIVSLIKSKEDNVFLEDENWERYEKCVLAPKLDDEKSGVKRLFPKLSKGSVELSTDIKIFGGKIALEFDWEDKDKTRVKFSSIVRQANELFKKLKPGNQSLYIFIDELEISLGKSKIYERDVRLIRDLIIALYNLNLEIKKNQHKLSIIAAIRSEVINATASAGKEINKLINDFGIILTWHQAATDLSHPLLRIILKRIWNTERKLIPSYNENPTETWSRYFPEVIKSKPAFEYILYQTWYRPRDIVRLLLVCQQFFPDKTKFDNQVFDQIRKEYSTQSWGEQVEELRIIYSQEELEGIKRIMYGLKGVFSLNDITVACDEKRKIYPEVDAVLSKHRLAAVLASIYRVGIIGNTGSKVRFSFRGDDDILLDKPMRVHDALVNFLAIEFE